MRLALNLITVVGAATQVSGRSFNRPPHTMKKLPKRHSMILSAVLAGFTILTGSLHAATLTLNGSGQGAATIRSDAANINRNFGGDGALQVGTTIAPAILRGVLSFSLAGIPEGATIDSITLRMRQANPDATSVAGPATINLHLLTTPFTEGAGTGSVSSSANVTWNNSTTATPWTTAGGDFNGSVISSITADASSANGAESTFTGSDFIAAAQANIGGTLSMVMKLETEDTASRRVFAFFSDNAATGDSPLLTINYTIPEPGTATLAAIAGFGLLVSRRRA